MCDRGRDAVRVGTALAVAVDDVAALPAAVAALGLTTPRPVVVVVGGAGALPPAQLARLQPLFDAAILPVAARLGAAVIDGGTRSGVMRALGESRWRLRSGVPLVGVAARGTVRLPEQAHQPDAADLEPHHSHLVLVPGDTWGDESPWLTRVAAVVAGPCPSVTVLINGGDIALRDVGHSVAAERPVLVLAGSGRAADDLAAAAHGSAPDVRAGELATSGLLRVVAPGDAASLTRALMAALTAAPT